MTDHCLSFQIIFSILTNNVVLIINEVFYSEETPDTEGANPCKFDEGNCTVDGPTFHSHPIEFKLPKIGTCVY